MREDAKLPVHGFVLAGGKSTRMGQDKALLRLDGRTLVEIAVEKLRGFCAGVSISGNRNDLMEFVPVVREERVDAGPAAGIEAGLRAARQPWCLFVPVDVPLLPGELLRRWVEAVMERGARASYLRCGADVHPALCAVRRDAAQAFGLALEGGERRLRTVFAGFGDGLWIADATEFSPDRADAAGWFVNVNTKGELARVDAILSREGARA